MKNSNDYTIVELSEVQTYRNSFSKLNEYNHEFVDAVYDGKCNE